MNFGQFRAWLSANFYPNNELCLKTLGGKSSFHMSYNGQSGIMKIRLSTGKKGEVKENNLRKIFDRHRNAPKTKRNMTSFYTDPCWSETPNRVLAPYVAAVIKVWIERR